MTHVILCWYVNLSSPIIALTADNSDASYSSLIELKEQPWPYVLLRRHKVFFLTGRRLPSPSQIEDAAVLGVLFSYISDRSQITPMLHAYQDLRYTRATTSQLDSRSNQKM